MKNKKIIIVGAGITGLVASYELLKEGCQVTIIEKETDVGGLARSFQYDSTTFDIGPHRFFSDKETINNYIKNTLNNDFVNISRLSAVFFNGKYYKWPLNLLSIFKMSFKNIICIIFDLLFLKTKKADNYQEYVENKYGKTLYEIFFKGYTEKFFAVDAQHIHAMWAQESINRVLIVKKTSNILGLFKYFLKSNFVREKNFIYPKIGGIQTFSKNLKEKIIELGGKFELNAEIKEATITNNSILFIKTKETIYESDIVVWTAPITSLCKLLDIPTNLKYRNLIIFNCIIKFNKKCTTNNYQWCYFGDKNITLNRTSKPLLFSKYNIGSGYDSVCVEVSCSPHDSFWHNPNELKDKIISELIQINIISSNSDIIKIYPEKIENVYPVYTLEFENDLTQVKNKLSKINNLYLAGRSGLFWYNNMDDSIENGIAISRIINETK
ncbi:MAG: FAD-dependent oxidoreductase [Endomicrobiaceae bacterium]|nr:FAD-dependent oxidoreductase [Endomicrobiaceae bacterium]